MLLRSSALEVKGLKDICTFRMSLQASNTYCRELTVERANSLVRTALRCRALCWITKYVKYAARVALKLYFEMLMRVVWLLSLLCCVLNGCSSIATFCHITKQPNITTSCRIIYSGLWVHHCKPTYRCSYVTPEGVDTCTWQNNIIICVWRGINWLMIG